MARMLAKQVRALAFSGRNPSMDESQWGAAVYFGTYMNEQRVTAAC